MPDINFETAVAVSVYFVLINLLAFVAMWRDKVLARKQQRRIPEANLLFVALIGGWVGAKVAQHRFRHKTRKQPFRFYLDLIGVVLLLGAVVFLTGSQHWILQTLRQLSGQL